MADPTPEILQLRESIDAIDAQLVALLNERAAVAKRIGAVKGRDDRPFFTPEREREVFERLRAINAGPLLPDQLRSIFREIVSAARALEKPLSCAYWGPQGTFSHLASIQTFGASADHVPCESIREVFEQVEQGKTNYGIVPVENSLAGVVPETLDSFPLTNVKICAEQYVAIHHHLVTLATDLGAIERVYAGPQPSVQCRQWLRTNLPHAEVVEVMPTAKAAERALHDPNGAAIANRMGAHLVGIPILVEHIEDNAQNRTRFLVIGFNEPVRTGRDKTSLMFNLRNQPGQLYRALGCLDREGVNLLMIESRPSQRGSFEYLFFIDCVGHRSEANVARAIEALREAALEVAMLGSYPSAESDQ